MVILLFYIKVLHVLMFHWRIMLVFKSATQANSGIGVVMCLG